MRRSGSAILGLVLLASCALGDVVYLRNGKKYEGIVRRRGNKVIIELPHATIEVPADQVVHIEKKALATQPAGARPAAISLQFPTPGKPFTIQDATRPEPVLFMLMRNLAATPAGMASHQLRQQIERWRAIAHDRKRKVAHEWLSPKDFVRRRKAYAIRLKEATELLRKAKRVYGNKPGDVAERRKHTKAAGVKLRLAARDWADPLLRNFLLAVADLSTGSAHQAEPLFRELRSAAPRVAAFHQGHAMALLELDRATDALAAYVEALRLRPDSRDAVRLVREAMKKVPGAQTTSRVFLEARELMAQYEDTRTYTGTSFRSQRWLMPGKDVHARDGALPALPYDRLVLRQAVGVPVGKNVLLVDESAVKDALEVHVGIGEGTAVPGSVRRTSYYGGTKPRPPLTLVRVGDCVFTPLKTGQKEAKFAKGRNVTFYGLPIYQQMSSRVREVRARIQQVAPDETLRLSVGLSAGEAAAPVVTEDGRLAGFFAGKTDVLADGGGPDRFIPLSQLEGLLKRAGSSYTSAGYGTRRKVIPKEVKGRFFVVYATGSEKLEP